MHVSNYLLAELPNYVAAPAKHRYALSYHWIKFRRFLALNIMAFSFQYLCIYHLKAPYPIYTIYPAIGIAFTVMAILGENAMLGLVLGCITAYFLKHYSVLSATLYTMADIGCAYLGAILCRNIFTSDIPKLTTPKIWRQFFFMSGLVASLSGLLREVAVIAGAATLPPLKKLGFIYLNLALADWSSIILFYAFLSTWLSVYMSREKLSVNKVQLSIFILYLLAMIVSMKNIAAVYGLLVGVVAIPYVAYKRGLVLSSLLLYVVSMLSLTYFSLHQLYYLEWLGIEGYTLAPVVLFLSITSGILIASCVQRAHHGLDGTPLESA